VGCAGPSGLHLGNCKSKARPRLAPHAAGPPHPPPQPTGATRLCGAKMGVRSSPFSYTLTRLPSLSSWSMLSCRTMPRRLFSWCTTTCARVQERGREGGREQCGGFLSMVMQGGLVAEREEGLE